MGCPSHSVYTAPANIDGVTEQRLCIVQVSVASADGFAFGPIAAYSAIEAARESAAQANTPHVNAAVGRRLSLTGLRCCKPVHVAWHHCTALLSHISNSIRQEQAGGAIWCRRLLRSPGMSAKDCTYRDNLNLMALSSNAVMPR